MRDTRFSFVTEAGVGYTVQRTDSLNPVNWQPLTNIMGNGSVWQVIDPGVTNVERYYRVVSP